jgi:hypothetical protein
MRVTSSPPIGGCYETLPGPMSSTANMASGNASQVVRGNASRQPLGAGRLRYRFGSLVAGGCAGPSGSILPWSSRNGGYRSVINAT